MDWRHINFDWNRARSFLVTAEEGSLSAAARALGMSQPTLGRQVAALEDELGVVLFERLGRGLTLTPSGVSLVEHVRAMGEAASQVALTASGQQEAIEGRVSISATEMYAGHVLPEILRELRAAHPGIEVEVIATNTLSDLRRREADIALRAVRPTDPELIAKHVATDAAFLYATPDYLESVGNPKGFDDFANVQFVGFDDNLPFQNALNERGFSLSPANFALRTASHLVNWNCVLAGLGIGVAPQTVGDGEPCVRRVMERVDEMEFPVWLVAHREVKTSARVRLIFDAIANALVD